MNSPPEGAYLKIMEQPAPDRVRFRYQSEGHSPLIGISSTPLERTFPTVQVVGYQGKALLIVSCVTKDEPYRPHPFNIDGKDGCKKGVFTINIPTDTMTVKLCSIGIKCVKKKEIEDSLKLRNELRIDPFQTGFDVKKLSFDFSCIRLCFQVFLESEKGKFNIPLPPVVSDPIYDTRYFSDLIINKISHCVCRVDEEPEIILLCGKVSKEDIQIRFYEEMDGCLIWEGYGSFTPSQIHKQVAICFKVPKYFNYKIENPVRVQLQLKRSTTGGTSESIPFEFLPSNEIGRKRKMPKMESLLDLARCFEDCRYNPLMNINHEEASNHRNYIKPQSNEACAVKAKQNSYPSNEACAVKAKQNSYPFNIPQRSSCSAQPPLNMPFVQTVQPVENLHPVCHRSNEPIMVFPEPEIPDDDYQPIPESVIDFDDTQFSYVQDTNSPFDNIEVEEDVGHSHTRTYRVLERNTIDNIYQVPNQFY